MSTPGPTTYIEKLICAIETANELDFDASNAKNLKEGNRNDPSSAYLLDEQGNQVLWLNFGIPSGQLTLDVVNAIAPAFKKGKIASVSFPGEWSESDFEAPAHKELTKLIHDQEKDNRSCKTCTLV